ncbi:MAG TPA: SAM-dependent methyltransferase, partial [Rhodocyclaceae bacterium]|nr:SAM-dependent methyltransferase [Rhodocyclaceae bacterium]
MTNDHVRERHAFLPQPDAAAVHASAALCRRIADEIEGAGGWMPFSRFMEQALYAPGLGYYSGGAHKFGPGGDFVTAPELTPLFARTLATQAAQVLAESSPEIIEAGAGSGALAAELLLALERQDALPDRYRILELSGELRQRQQETLRFRAPHLASRVEWLEMLPQRCSGLVLGNEVIDAMPVALVVWQAEGIFERGVILSEAGGFVWADRPAEGELLAAAAQLPVRAPYLSEIGLAGRAWV